MGAFVTFTIPQNSGLDVCLGSLSLAQILTGQTSVPSLSNHTDAVESEKSRGWERWGGGGVQAERQEKDRDGNRRTNKV